MIRSEKVGRIAHILMPRTSCVNASLSIIHIYYHITIQLMYRYAAVLCHNRLLNTNINI